MTFHGPTFRTEAAAQSRLAMALDWGDLHPDQNPRVVTIKHPRQRIRYAIATD